MHSLLQWYKIADSPDSIHWNKNNMAIVEAGEKTITLIKLQNVIRGCTNKCPHAGAPLIDGFIDAIGNIVCPLHKYKFSLKNGYNVSGEGYYLKTFIIEQREDGIYIGLD